MSTSKLPRKKPKILTFVGYYRPGYKAGGILRSIENMVEHLHDTFDFVIVTRDRDLGETAAYPNVNTGSWHQVGSARVLYLAPHEIRWSRVRQVVKSVGPDVVYLNSYFEPLTIWYLLNRRLNLVENCPLIIAPRGEFAWASLKIRYPKKRLYMFVERITGLTKKAVWQASSHFELADITQVLKIKSSVIRIATNLPIAMQSQGLDSIHDDAPSSSNLRVVFLSRISPEKNLEVALNILSAQPYNVSFDIYGPIDDKGYWDRCQEIVSEMPANVLVRYRGPILPSAVGKTLRSYDLFFLPSGGENYGHVIAESLSVGTCVLISTATPWRNLKEKGLGWDIPLDKLQEYRDVIQTVAREAPELRRARRTAVQSAVSPILKDRSILEANRRLFLDELAREQSI